jgi:hypothetical protein
METKKKTVEGEVRDTLFLGGGGGGEKLIARRFPGNARSSF